MIMMNHAAYPQTPGKNKPASASSVLDTERCGNGSDTTGSFFPMIWRWVAF